MAACRAPGWQAADMRVLLLTDALPLRPRGGTDLHVRELRAELADRGIDVHLESIAGTSADAVGPVGSPGVRLRRSFASPGACRLFAGLLRDFQPDIVHFHSLQGLHWRFPAIAAEAGARTVWTHHDMFALCQRVHLRDGDGQQCPGPLGGRRSGLKCGRCFGGMARLLGPALFPLRTSAMGSAMGSCDVHVAPSAWVAELLFEHGVEAGDVHVVAPAVPAPTRPAELPDDGPPRLVCAADLRREQGADLAVSAVASLDEPVQLSVHGGSPAPPASRDAVFERLLKRDAAAVAEGRVRLHGRFEESQLGGLLDGAAALIVPSRSWETFGRTANVALLAGVPVIAADHGGLAEQVVEGLNGALFEPGDSASLAAAIRRLLAHGPSLRRQERWPVRPELGRSSTTLLRLYEGGA